MHLYTYFCNWQSRTDELRYQGYCATTGVERLPSRIKGNEGSASGVVQVSQKTWAHRFDGILAYYNLFVS